MAIIVGFKMNIENIMNLESKEENRRKRNYKFFMNNWRKYMTIIIDTREELRHIPNEFSKQNIPYIERQLPLADFGFVFNEDFELNSINFKLAIERKQKIDEIIGNFWDKKKDHNGDNRFSRNIKMSLAQGYKYIYLCEKGTWMDLYAGNYRSETKPQAISGKLHSLKLYNITLEFIPASIMPQYIIDVILYHLRMFYIYGQCEMSQNLRKYIEEKRQNNLKRQKAK